DGADGFVAPGNDRAKVIDAVRRGIAVVTGPDASAWRRRARATVEERFSAPACVARYEEIYLDLVARKGLRPSPGPATAEWTPGALVGDILFHFNYGRWEAMEESAERLYRHPEPVAVTELLRVVALAARQAAARDRGRLADLLFRVLDREGAMNGELAKLWGVAAPPGPGGLVVAKALMAHCGADPEGVMLAVEGAVNAGAVAEAARLAETGAARFPQERAFVEVARMLRQKQGET
ncbi:MAG: hypothetical protein HQK87_08070, partial [Nitrospinae bacterium]|nr:hypothetical protein [Nitrospinota bacterium]